MSLRNSSWLPARYPAHPARHTAASSARPAANVRSTRCFPAREICDGAKAGLALGRLERARDEQRFLITRGRKQVGDPFEMLRWARRLVRNRHDPLARLLSERRIVVAIRDNV